MIFLDTSGLFSVLIDDDENHLQASELLKAASGRLVHSAILAELIALVDARRKNRIQALEMVKEIFDHPDFKVVWLSEIDYRQAMALLNARPDKHCSLCDAASFIIMRRFNIREALTTDHHFEQEGFLRLLKS